MTFRGGLICCSLLFLSAMLSAGEPTLVQQALDGIGSASHDDWAFTETTVTNSTTIVKHHDPTRAEGERWTLVSVDGRPPTDDEREEILGDDGEDDSSEGGGDSDDELRAIITPNSLKLVDDSPTHATYSFEPVAEDDEDAKLFANVDATLRINKDGPFVEEMEMRSRGPFSLRTGIKVKKFLTLFTFVPVGSEGTVLPEVIDTRFLGRLFLVKKINETVRVTYSDYRRP